MNPRNPARIEALLSRPDKIEMTATQSRVAVVDNCLGIGGVWYASGREFHSSEGFPHKAEIAIFLHGGKPVLETEHARGWSPSLTWHRRVFLEGQLVVHEHKFISGDAIFDILTFINKTENPADLEIVLRGRASAVGTVYYRDGRIHVDEEKARTLAGTHMVLACEPAITGFRISEEDPGLVPNFDPNVRELGGNRLHYLAGFPVHVSAGGRTRAAVCIAWGLSQKQAMANIPRNLVSSYSSISRIKANWSDFFGESVPQLRIPETDLEKLYYYSWYVTHAQTMPPQGRLKHPYIAPTKFAHVGVWLQDHAYIATGTRWMRDASLSRDSIRLLYENQFTNGLMASSVNAYGVRVYDNQLGKGVTLDIGSMGRYTPREIPSQLPPAFTVAANQVFNRTWNMDFLRECYTAALKLDNWMAEEREGSDGLFKAVHLMDIEHLAGAARMGEHEWIKAVDVSALNVYHRRILQSWGAILGDRSALRKLEERAERTERSIHELMWNRVKGLYMDLLPDGKLSPVETAAGFYALFLKDLRGRLPEMLASLADKNRFWTPTPVPTMSLLGHDSGQGVSQSVDWYIINGLARWGCREPAEQMTRKLLHAHLPNGLPESKEGFDPLTGAPKGYPDFAWVTLATDLLMSRVLGIQPSRGELLLQPWLPAAWEYASVRKLAIGPYTLDLDYQVEDHMVSIRMAAASHNRLSGPLPVTVVWRALAGQSIESVSHNGTIVRQSGHDEARVSLRCASDAERVVSIRMKKR